MLLAGSLEFDLVIVDAVSLRTSGERICRQLEQSVTRCPIILIRPPEYPTTCQHCELTLHPPVSLRKLTGIVRRMLSEDPLGAISCGPFRMNRTTRILQANGSEVQLNPKLAELIELFMMHPNQVLDRERIMRKVWKTDYVGDTRTLDVHIRHARKLIESNPQRPQYLKTVRGVGYRLDVDLI